MYATKTPYVLLCPIIQFRSKNPVRRRGVVGCVRSCLFNADVHWWMVNEMNVIPALLLPLVTETEFTEAEKEGMDPILWMQVRLSEHYSISHPDILTP